MLVRRLSLSAALLSTFAVVTTGAGLTPARATGAADVQASESGDSYLPANVQLQAASSGGVLYYQDKSGGGLFLRSADGATTRAVTGSLSGSLLTQFSGPASGTIEAVSWQDLAGNPVGTPFTIDTSDPARTLQSLTPTPRGVAYVLEVTAPDNSIHDSLREHRTDGSDV